MPRPSSDRRLAFGATLVAGALVAGCATAGSADPAAAAPTASAATVGTLAEPGPVEKPELVGVLDREAVESAVPGWVAAEVESAPDPVAAAALATVPPGAEVTVYLGTWCSDSRREMARFWKALDLAGLDPGFELVLVGVDRSKQQPAEQLAGHDVRFVPTFVVRRDGEEVGRIVESSPHGIEHDLLALLRGEARGVLSGRSDL